MKKRNQRKFVLAATSLLTSSAPILVNSASAQAHPTEELVMQALQSSNVLKKYYTLLSPADITISENFLTAFNKAKKDFEEAKKALSFFKGPEKDRLEQQLIMAENNCLRAARLIDAIKVGELLTKETSILETYIYSDIINESLLKAYQQQLDILGKAEKVFGKVSGPSNRKMLGERFLIPAKISKESVKFEISRYLQQKNIEQLINEEKIQEAKDEVQKLERLEKRSRDIKYEGNRIHPGKYPKLSGMEQQLLEHKSNITEQFILTLQALSTDSLNPTVYGTDKEKQINRDVIIVAEKAHFIELKNLNIKGNVTIVGAQGTKGNIKLSGVNVEGSIFVREAENVEMYKVAAKEVVVEEKRETTSVGRMSMTGKEQEFGPTINIDKSSSIDCIFLKNKVMLEVGKDSIVGCVEVDSNSPWQPMVLGGNLLETMVSVKGKDPMVQLAANSTLRQINVLTQAEIQSENGANLEKIIMNAVGEQTLTISGNLASAEVSILGKQNEVILNKNSALKSVLFSNEGYLNVGVGSVIPLVVISPATLGANVTLQGDLSKSSVTIENANARIFIKENTIIKEVKKNPEVTGPVMIDNKGRVESAIGVQIPNNGGSPGGSEETRPPVDRTAPNKPVVNAVNSEDTVVTGQAEANSLIRVKAGTNVIGSGRADQAGNFSVSIPKQSKDTLLTVSATDSAGNESEGTTIQVTEADTSNHANFTGSSYDANTNVLTLTGLTGVEAESNFDLHALIYSDGESDPAVHSLSEGYSLVESFSDVNDPGEFFYSAGTLTVILTNTDATTIENLSGFSYNGRATDLVTASRGWNQDLAGNAAGEVKNIEVAVTPVNRAPKVNVNIPDQLILGKPKDIDISGLFLDDDGDSLTITVASADPSVATANIIGSRLTVMPGTEGSTQLTVTARDGKGGEVTATINISVKLQLTIKEQFPDTNLANAIASWLNKSVEDTITKEIIQQHINSGKTALNLASKKINSLEGFDIFNDTTLKELYISYNTISSIDVSKLTSLEILELNNNKVSTLNIQNLVNLKRLSASGNLITSIDFSGLSQLERIDLYYNKLSAIDVNHLTKLTNLSVGGNFQISSIDVSNLVNLTDLSISGASITGLDVSNLTKLVTLYANDNKLSTLDVSSLGMLQQLQIKGNKLTSFPTGLETLTPIKQVNVSSNSINYDSPENNPIHEQLKAKLKANYIY